MSCLTCRGCSLRSAVEVKWLCPSLKFTQSLGRSQRSVHSVVPHLLLQASGEAGGAALIFVNRCHSYRYCYLIVCPIVTTVLKWHLTSREVPLDPGSCSWCLSYVIGSPSSSPPPPLVWSSLVLNHCSIPEMFPRIRCYFHFNMVRGDGI